MKTAFDLHQVWPEAKFVCSSQSFHLPLPLTDPAEQLTQIVIPDAGHSAIEAGIEKALIEATNEFAKLKY